MANAQTILIQSFNGDDHEEFSDTNSDSDVPENEIVAR